MPFNGLNDTFKYLRFLQFAKEERKLHSCVEVSVLKLLDARLSRSRNLKLPSVTGIRPENEFSSSAKILSLEALEIKLGILPLR